MNIEEINISSVGTDLFWSDSKNFAIYFFWEQIYILFFKNAFNFSLV